MTYGGVDIEQRNVSFVTVGDAEYDKIKKQVEQSNTKAVDMLVDLVQNVGRNGVWQEFVQALESAGIIQSLETF